MLYPNFSYRTLRAVHFVYELFYHFLPALFYDIIMRLKGLKPICFNIAKRYKAAADTGKIYILSMVLLENIFIQF